MKRETRRAARPSWPGRRSPLSPGLASNVWVPMETESSINQQFSSETDRKSAKIVKRKGKILV